LIEAKQAVESFAARHGLVTQRAGCLGLDGGGACWPNATGWPTSRNIFSRPAGATEMIIRANLSVLFLKLCGLPMGAWEEIGWSAPRKGIVLTFPPASPAD
jgi:hypothetical protein